MATIPDNGKTAGRADGLNGKERRKMMKRKGFCKWFAAAGALLLMLLIMSFSAFAGDGIDFYFDSQGYGRDIGLISTSFQPGDLLYNSFLNDYNPTAPGCRFRAWSLSPNSDVWAGDKVLTTPKGGTLRLYARWDVSDITFVFNGNGATGGAIGELLVPGGKAATLPSGAAFSRPGYTFRNWTTNPDGSGTVYSAGQAVTCNLGNYPVDFVSHDVITLYAQWIGTGPDLPPYPVNPSSPIIYVTSVDRNSRKMVLHWKPVPGASGFEVIVKSHGRKQVIPTADNKLKVTNIRGMAIKNKTVRFRIRAYQIVNGSKMYIARSAQGVSY